ncbi:MAG: hypothetical protein ACPF9D_05700 [Owenweeksia sp.]
MSKKFKIEIKEHKLDFVLDLLGNMPFVTISPLDEEQEKTPDKKTGA